MRTFVLALTALASLTLPSLAAAKEVVRAEVCGASGCTTIRDRPTLEAVVRPGEARPAPPASSFFTVTAIARDGSREHPIAFSYDPASRLVRGVPGSPWYAVAASAAAALAAATEGIEPFPMPELAAVEVNGRRVTSGLEPYARLLELPTSPRALPDTTDWILIDVEAKRPNPWTDGANDLVFSPSNDLVQRGGAVLRVPSELAATIQRAASPEAAATREPARPERFPWLPAGMALAAVAALVVAAVALVRRRSWRLPARSASRA